MEGPGLVRAEGARRSPQGEVGADAVQERRLADALRGEHGLGVVAVREEVGHDLARGGVQVGDLVGGQVLGEQPAAVVEAELLDGQPADALGQAALDLAAVDLGREGAAGVVDDLDRLDAVGAAQAVHLDLGQGRAEDVVGEGAAALAALVVVEARGGVVSLGREVHALDVGAGDELLPGQPVAAVHDTQPLAQLATGELGGAAVEVGAGAGGGGRCVGHGRGACLRDRHARGLDGQGARRDEAQLLGHALPHLDGSRGHVHGAVGVDVHQGAGLVEDLVREGDAEAGRHQR